MNVCLLIYDGFCHMEVSTALYLFHEHNVFSAALEDRTYVSEEKLRYMPEKIIGQFSVDDIDLIIVPGTDSDTRVHNNPVLKDFFNELNRRNKYIAGICGGVALMARYGLLDNKRFAKEIPQNYSKKNLFERGIHQKDEQIVIDGNIITSVSAAFVEFGLELGKIMNVYSDENDYKETYNWLKNIRK